MDIVLIILTFGIGALLVVLRVLFALTIKAVQQLFVAFSKYRPKTRRA